MAQHGPKVMITPTLRKPIKFKKTRRISGDFGKIVGFFTCLVEKRGVGVTTTLGPGEFICPEDYYLHTDHYLGREFRSLGTFAVSLVFSKILHIDSANPYHSG